MKFSAFINNNTEINFDAIISFTSLKEMPNLHTLISDSFEVVKFCSSRGDGRTVCEVRVKNGVRMKHMITLE